MAHLCVTFKYFLQCCYNNIKKGKTSLYVSCECSASDDFCYPACLLKSISDKSLYLHSYIYIRTNILQESL